MTRIDRLFPAVFLSVSLGACQTGTSLDQATLFFNDVAFRGVVGSVAVRGVAVADSDYRTARLRRWWSPIRYHVINAPSPAARDLIDEVFKIAHAEAAIIAAPAATQRDSNFLIRFHDDGRFIINQVEHVNCYARTWAQKGEINKVEIHIGLDDNDHVDHCIVHELLHGFGMGHAETLPSAVNYNMRTGEVTKWDRLALKVLYDRRIETGMRRTEALPLARQIIKELLTNKPEGT